MIRILIFLTIWGLVSFNGLRAQGKKGGAVVVKATSAELMTGLQNALIQKYSLANLTPTIFAGKMNLDICDPAMNEMPKDQREKKAKAIAASAKDYFQTTPGGTDLMQGFSTVGVNFLKKPGSSIMVPQKDNMLDTYTYRLGELKQ